MGSLARRQTIYMRKKRKERKKERKKKKDF
jgi:hypothetical protein